MMFLPSRRAVKPGCRRRRRLRRGGSFSRKGDMLHDVSTQQESRETRLQEAAEAEKRRQLLKKRRHVTNSDFLKIFVPLM